MKELLPLVLLLPAGIVWIIGIIFMIKNNRVYEFRVRILHASMEHYLKLPEYNTMLYKNFFRKLSLENYFSKDDAALLRRLIDFKEIIENLEQKKQKLSS